MNHVTTLATKQAELIVKVLLAFLQGELAICSKLICDICLLVFTGFRLVIVIVCGTGFGSQWIRVVLSVRVWVWLAYFVRFLVRIWDC